MPKGKQKSADAGFRPLMQIERVAHETLPRLKIDKMVAEKLGLYTRYFEEATGIGVTMDEVIEKALERLFNADHDFRKWQGLRSAEQTKSEVSEAKSQVEATTAAPKAEVEGAVAKAETSGVSSSNKRPEGQDDGAHHKRPESQGDRHRA